MSLPPYPQLVFRLLNLLLPKRSHISAIHSPCGTTVAFSGEEEEIVKCCESLLFSYQTRDFFAKAITQHKDKEKKMIEALELNKTIHPHYFQD